MRETETPTVTWFARAQALGFSRILLFAQTFVLLLCAKSALLLVPVDRVLNWRRSIAPAPRRLSLEERHRQLRLVRWAVQAVSKHSPIKFVCFPQSLAARALLHRRGIPTQLYYGVMRREGKLATHTWLVADGFNVIGGEGSEAFSVLATY